MEEKGVVMVCCHDYVSVPENTSAVRNLASASSELSEMSREASVNGECAMGGLLRSAGSKLAKAGFHAVESGFMDFALPDVSEAANRLLDAGCTHIVALGVPALLHRHPYSSGGPSESVERLEKELPGTNIVYVKPDPAPIAPYLADIVMSRVLEADENGATLKDMLRKR
jgi:hypothetical protein